MQEGKTMNRMPWRVVVGSAFRPVPHVDSTVSPVLKLSYQVQTLQQYGIASCCCCCCCTCCWLFLLLRRESWLVNRGSAQAPSRGENAWLCGESLISFFLSLSTTLISAPSYDNSIKPFAHFCFAASFLMYTTSYMARDCKYCSQTMMLLLLLLEMDCSFCRHLDCVILSLHHACAYFSQYFLTIIYFVTKKHRNLRTQTRESSRSTSTKPRLSTNTTKSMELLTTITKGTRATVAVFDFITCSRWKRADESSGGTPVIQLPIS